MDEEKPASTEGEHSVFTAPLAEVFLGGCAQASKKMSWQRRSWRSASEINRINMERRLRDHDYNGYHSTTHRETWSRGQYRSCLGGGGVDHTAPGNLLCGLSWPPRSYTCSFCKREFRSAQALGGHMNVHRRDRARLRESPPWEPPTSNLDPSPSPKPNPNPNPNPSLLPNRVLLPNLNHEPDPQLDDLDLSSTLPGEPPQVTRIFPLLQLPAVSRLSSSSSTAYGVESSSSKIRQAKSRKIMNAFSRVGEMKGLAGEDQVSSVLERKNAVKGLNMEIGVRGDLEELDLELRLGYA
ncbi:hypothetical protein Taro_049563 [Colocasia esculenta]|uniref:C2H2-type domain-containing protein n=1 Tax=Colocasia esculenta TaxID=4460 RepID=A0A843XBC1_COLES|nr:hypothetical protein [Colocasia esculenta]